FCGSDDGLLVPSPSTSLSFVSSESGHNVTHPVTDLALLSGLPPLRRPTYETGDGRSRSGQLSAVLTSGTHMQDAGTMTPEQFFFPIRQTPIGERRGPSVLPKTEARQAVPPLPEGPFWSKDMLKVAAVGNQHYLRERAALSRSTTLSSMTAIDQVGYICRKNSKSSLTTSPAVRVPEESSRTLRPSTAESEVFLTRSTTGLYRSSPCFQDSNSSGETLCLEPLRLRDLVVLRYPQFRWLTTVQSEQCTEAGVQDSQQESMSQAFRTGSCSRNTLLPFRVDAIVEALQEIELDTSTVSLHLSTCTYNRASSGDDKNLGDSLTAAKRTPPDEIGFGSPVAATISEVRQAGDACPSQSNQSAMEFDLVASSSPKSGTRESQENVEAIDRPSSEGPILTLNTSTIASIDGNGPTLSAAGSCIAIQSIREGSTHLGIERVDSTSSTRRRLSLRMLEGPSFESVYNSILQ
ncbi:unnamed protein product, partial [Ixodes hexagonus]